MAAKQALNIPPQPADSPFETQRVKTTVASLRKYRDTSRPVSEQLFAFSNACGLPFGNTRALRCLRSALAGEIPDILHARLRS